MVYRKLFYGQIHMRNLYYYILDFNTKLKTNYFVTRPFKLTFELENPFRERK